MRPKSFLILLIVGGILSVAAYWLAQRQNMHPPQEQLGLNLFEALPVNQIVGIDIIDRNHRVNLKKGESVWTVASRYGYPADFSKLKNFIKKINDLKIGRSFEADPATRARLSLYAPDDDRVPADQSGTRVILHGQAPDTHLADLILGLPRSASSGGGGHYVFLSDRSRVYLVDGDFRFLKPTSVEWLEKELADVDPQGIERVVCRSTGDDTVLYTLKRSDPSGVPEFVDPPDGQTVLSAKIDTAFKALDGLRIDDILDPATNSDSVPAPKRLHLEYRLYSGIIYDIYPFTMGTSEDTRRYCLKIEVRSGPAEAVADSGGNSTAPSSPPEPALAAEQLQRRLGAWTYIVPNWRYDRFITAATDFFDKPQPAE